MDDKKGYYSQDLSSHERQNNLLGWWNNKVIVRIRTILRAGIGSVVFVLAVSTDGRLFLNHLPPEKLTSKSKYTTTEFIIDSPGWADC